MGNFCLTNWVLACPQELPIFSYTCLYFSEYFVSMPKYIHCLQFVLLVSTGEVIQNINDLPCNVKVLFSLVLHYVFWLLKGVKNVAVLMSMAVLSIECSPSVINLSLQGHGPLYQPLIWQLTELEHHLMDRQVNEWFMKYTSHKEGHVVA